MTNVNPPPGVDPTTTIKQVVRHLVAAEACALRGARTRPEWGDVAVGAAVLTSRALRLLPEGEDVDDVPTPGGVDASVLLRAAEQLTRSHPIEAFPAGTSVLVADLYELISQAPA